MLTAYSEPTFSIGIQAFKQCTELKNIFIPKNTKLDGDSTYLGPFCECSEDLKIYMQTGFSGTGCGEYWNYYTENEDGDLVCYYPEYDWTYDRYYTEIEPVT